MYTPACWSSGTRRSISPEVVDSSAHYRILIFFLLNMPPASCCQKNTIVLQEKYAQNMATVMQGHSPTNPRSKHLVQCCVSCLVVSGGHQRNRGQVLAQQRASCDWTHSHLAQRRWIKVSSDPRVKCGCGLRTWSLEGLRRR